MRAVVRKKYGKIEVELEPVSLGQPRELFRSLAKSGMDAVLVLDA